MHCCSPQPRIIEKYYSEVVLISPIIENLGNSYDTQENSTATGSSLCGRGMRMLYLCVSGFPRALNKKM